MVCMMLIAAPCMAGGVTPVEGVNFRIVDCPAGTPEGSACVSIPAKAGNAFNVSAKKLAKMFGTNRDALPGGVGPSKKAMTAGSDAVSML